jgi:hypothetical protein
MTFSFLIGMCGVESPRRREFAGADRMSRPQGSNTASTVAGVRQVRETAGGKKGCATWNDVAREDADQHCHDHVDADPGAAGEDVEDIHPRRQQRLNGTTGATGSCR